MMDARDLFDKIFKEGEEIFVITEYDDIRWGKLKYVGDYRKTASFVLIQLDGSEIELDWEATRFFSHDGFPIQKLKGADGSISIEKIDTTDVQKAIAQLATQSMCPICQLLVSNDDMSLRYRPRVLNSKGDRIEVCDKCYEIMEDEGEDGLPRGFSLVFGDPFLTENVFVDVFWPGNNGPIFWGNHQFEESILLSAKDNAKAILYDAPSIYFLEG